ncbi:hypothetical protein [Motilibacter deserti]|uniref:hypothetical protein n=1 Tax=Motilibacter deserti TaxID=2714956 RepID=UPI001E61B9A5|nr:hypothetical protein [Motilibacter deserti]
MAVDFPRWLAVPVASAAFLGAALVSAPGAAADVVQWPDEAGDGGVAQADVTAYSLGVFADFTGGSVRLAAYDATAVTRLVISVSLDVDADGSADYVIWKYARPGPVEVIRESDAETVCTNGFAAYDPAASTVSVYAPSSCVGSPASARAQVYVGGYALATGAADFAPDADSFSPAVRVSPASPLQPPAATPAPTPAPPAPPAPTPTPTPTPTTSPVPPVAPEPGTAARTAPRARASVSYSRGVATVCVVARSGSAPLRAERVQLLTKPPRAAAWRAGPAYTLNRVGRACVTQPAVRVWQYRWRVLGSPAVTPVTTGTVRVEPRPVRER